MKEKNVKKKKNYEGEKSMKEKKRIHAELLSSILNTHRASSKCI
jgi:hypothetical protein